MKWLITSVSMTSASTNWVTTEPKRLRQTSPPADLLVMPAPRETHRDPYYRCEMHCTHDLGPGMSIDELLGNRTPHPSVRVNASPSPAGVAASASPQHPSGMHLPVPAGS